MTILFNLLLILVSSMTLLPVAFAQSTAGGGSSGTGGGGTGIACFASAADAAEAHRLRERGQTLSTPLTLRIKTLFVTDYWEHMDQNFVVVGQGEDDAGYLNRILNTYLSGFAPSFLRKVQEAETRVSLDRDRTFDATGIIQQIEDTGPIGGPALRSPEYGACAVVQIAVRYAKTDAQGKITTWVDVDRALYDRLGLDHGRMDPTKAVINRAILRFHEALYLLGYGLGQSTSEKVRWLTASLITENTYENFLKLASRTAENTTATDVISQPGLQAFMMIIFLYKNGFGDFPYFEHVRMSPEKRQFREDYQRIEQSLLQVVQNINDLGFPEPLKSQVGSISLAQFFSSVSPSEAFMMVAQIATMGGNVRDFYTLLDPTQDDMMEVRQVCQFAGTYYQSIANGYAYNTILTKQMFERAKSYCEDHF